MSMLPVRTPVFEGPLDLLLHLIERDDLDITAVSLVQVTEEYLAALRSAETIDLRALAEFVAVGARLLLLKSRALLPRTPDQVSEDELEADAIAQDLTAQLEEYRAFKSAASYLRQLDEAGHRSFVRIAPPPNDWLPTGLERVTLNALVRSLTKAMERLPAAPEPERLPRPPVTVAERRQAILSAIRERGQIDFASLVADCRSRLEAVVTFMALLDLLKSEDVLAEQDISFGEIVLRAAPAK